MQKILRGTGLTITLGVGVLLSIQSMTATVTSLPSWSNVTAARVEAINETDTTWKSWHEPHCEPQRAIVEDYTTRDEHDICVFTSTNAELAVFVQSSGGQSAYALKLEDDDVFHRVTTLLPSAAHLVLLKSDVLMGAMLTPPHIMMMYSLENVHEKLVKTNIQTGQSSYNTLYSLDAQDAKLFLDNLGQTVPVGRIAVSSNEKYAVAQTLGRGIVTLNLETREVKWITDDTASQQDTMLAISDDGTSVIATGDDGAIHRVYVDLNNCGNEYLTATFDNDSICYSVNFAEQMKPYLSFGKVYNPEFLSGGKNFALHIWDESENRSTKLVFTPDPNSRRLDYLALGDSYSSGEGDIGRDGRGNSYYLPNTHSGDDNCHISSRSYPFLLKQFWNISDNDMKSVACSGAQVVFDYYRPMAGYLGQNRRLMNQSNIEEKQNQALTSFIPGHVPQLEFIKKYQPRIVTLTGGGNDVGFADILGYCAIPAWYNISIVINSDCGYAVKGSELETMLYDSIDTQYAYNKRLLEKIREVSPTTKVVVIGYPSFVTYEYFRPCALNSGALTRGEIRMINEMVKHMNAMLQRLSYDMDVSFVDITDSLEGGRICEGSEYMTGVWPHITGDATKQEWFHPNAKGHARIAETIKNSYTYGVKSVPSQGLFEVTTDFVESFFENIIATTNIFLNTQLPVVLPVNSLAPGTPYSVTVYSTPTKLGTFTSEADGSANATISFEGIPMGKHMLVVEGTGPGGKPIRMYQSIQINVSADDFDGDGIPNQYDRCEFIVEWYDEQTGQNICDDVLVTDGEAQNLLLQPATSGKQKVQFVTASNITDVTPSNTAANSKMVDKKCQRAYNVQLGW